jgi:hypothetical protein
VPALHMQSRVQTPGPLKKKKQSIFETTIEIMMGRVTTL